MDLHVFPIQIHPPASLSIPSLWVFPVHQPWALVSCIQIWVSQPQFKQTPNQHFFISIKSKFLKFWLTLTYSLISSFPAGTL